MAQVDTEEAPAPTPASSPVKLSMLIVGGIAIALLTAGATWFMTRSDSAVDPEESAQAEQTQGAQAKTKEAKTKAPKKVEGPAIYLPIDPPFVVNLQDEVGARYLQVTMELMARDQVLVDNVKQHLPVIRNNLLLLLGSQRIADVNTREGKEKLRVAALAEVQSVLKEQGVKGSLEALYFTSFVMQ